MGFDTNLPIKERIAKRRRHKRIRNLSMLGIVFLLGISFIVSRSGTLSNEGNIKAIENKKDKKLVEESPDIVPGSMLEDGSDYIVADMWGILKDRSKLDTQDSKNIGSINIEDDRSEKNLNENTLLDDYSVLKEDIEKYVSKYEGRYGISFIDIKNQKGFGINDEERYFAASTFKIPLNLYLYKGITLGAINRNDYLVYSKEDYEDGAGIIKDKFSYGKSFTIKELSRLSLVYSDNIAANMIIRLVGKNNVKDYMREIGGVVVEDSNNVSCPKDMVIYMKEVYDFYQNNAVLGKELMDSFLNVELKDRIPRGVPKDIMVANKTGNLLGVVNDVAIVFHDTPYIVAIMTDGVTEDEEANEVIANISKKIYQFMLYKSH